LPEWHICNILRIDMDDTLLPTAAEAFGDVFVIGSLLTRLTDAALSDWDLTTRQWLLLAVLVRGFPDGPPTLSEAAGKYGSSRQNVKQIALGLESRGWLRLEGDPNDARATRLLATGKVAVFDTPEGVRRGGELLAAAFAGLQADEMLALGALLARWLDSLRSAGPSSSTPVPELTAGAVAPALEILQPRPGKARPTP
jgi:hypothetical protein